MPPSQAELSTIPARPLSAGERRIIELDGLRGLMTIAVILSHYFGELRHGLPVEFGWVAVDMFFVLSGFLIGRLILAKKDHRNFFKVFYIRRACRILPAYILTVCTIALLLRAVPPEWRDSVNAFPLWSYLTFSQVFLMAGNHALGDHWLAPTWTLAFEEHFYLLAPALLVLTPRRNLVLVLLAIAAFSLALRIAIFQFHLLDGYAGFVLLPARADLIVAGVLAAIAFDRGTVAWDRWRPTLRLLPVVALFTSALLYRSHLVLFDIVTPLALALGCAAYILCVLIGSPEARRFRSPTLRFFGNNGYCLYLTHLPVLGLMHGVILGSPPDLATPSQWLVTIAALPVCVFVGWAMTKLVEEPLTRYGRTWRWGGPACVRDGSGPACAQGDDTLGDTRSARNPQVVRHC